MKVAILGTWHVHTKEYTTGVLNNPNAEVAVVWDNDAERGKKFADEMNLPFNADLDAVLGDESIDSVVICTALCVIVPNDGDFRIRVIQYTRGVLFGVDVPGA